jgi:nicotinic acid mononucleotide adenylyltransferase
VTRPDYEISFAHIAEEIRERIVDLRKEELRIKKYGLKETEDRRPKTEDQKIYITDAVNLDVSATEIRRKIRAGEEDWRELVPQEVAKYIEKYDIY